MACIYATILPMTLIAREDKFGVDGFICSLPVTRAQVVCARYVVSWGSALACTLAALVLYTIFAAGDSTVVWSSASLGRALLILTGGLSLVLPFMVRFGWMGLLVGLIGAQVLGVAVLLISQLVAPDLRIRDALHGISDFINGWRAHLGGPGFLITTILVLGICNAISCSIAVFLYRRREL